MTWFYKIGFIRLEKKSSLQLQLWILIYKLIKNMILNKIQMKNYLLVYNKVISNLTDGLLPKQP